MTTGTPNLSPSQFDQVISRGVLHGRESVLVTDDRVDHPGPGILFVNKAFTELTGYRADEILGRTPRVLHGPLTSRELLDDLRSKLETRERFDGETINYRKSGEPFVMNWRVLPVELDDSDRYFIALHSDVTQLRQTERHETGLSYLESGIRSVMRLSGRDPGTLIASILTAFCSTVDVYMQSGEAVAQLGLISTGSIDRADEMMPGEMEIDFGPDGAEIRLGFAEIRGQHGTLMIKGLNEDRLELASLAHVQHFADMVASPVRTIVAESSIPD